MRAAVVGGAAYHMGKRRAQNEADDQYATEQAYAAQQPSGMTNDVVHELERLAKLKDEGILTQQEFDEQKAKILESA